MKEIEAAIEINASAGRVWQMLTDFGSFPDWNPFIRWVEGEFTEGRRVRVRMEPPDGPGGVYTSTLTKIDSPHEFRWAGGVKGLFEYEHSFVIEPLGDDRARFTQREFFRGLLIPLFRLFFIRFTRRGFKALNEALKERAEAGAKTST